MSTVLSTPAKEKSTYIITIAFFDEDGAAEVPTAISWSLSNEIGTIINSRSAVAIAVPAASNDIVLTNADLAFGTGEAGSTYRILTVQATYNSDAGTGLTLKDDCRFMIQDLLIVT